MEERAFHTGRSQRLESNLAIRKAVVIVGVVAVMLLAGAFIFNLLGTVRDTSDRPLKEFSVTVQTFENGNFRPSTIMVNRGDRVIIVFRSVDTTHGIAIDEYGLNTGPIDAGREKRVEFVADRVGAFRFYCNIVCSGLHLRQVGLLIVQ